MILFFFTYCYIIRTLPEMFDSAYLYWLMESVLFLIMSIYIFNKSKRNVFSLLFCASLLVLFIQQIIDRFLLLIGHEISDYVYIPVFSAALIVAHVSIFRNRYKWERLKSDNYDPGKIQKIYSKPNGVLTLIGAATSLSPKCSVRYTYSGKTIRFKRGFKNPVLCNTVIKETDIIKDTNIDENYFFARYERIKVIKYNLFNFNCRNLMD